MAEQSKVAYDEWKRAGEGRPEYMSLPAEVQIHGLRELERSCRDLGLSDETEAIVLAATQGRIDRIDRIIADQGCAKDSDRLKAQWESLKDSGSEQALLCGYLRALADIGVSLSHLEASEELDQVRAMLMAAAQIGR